MRTLVILLAGCALYAIAVAATRVIAPQPSTAYPVVTVAFLAAWLAVAAGNLWMGVARAGYSLGEEFPIFLLIFAVPALIAVVVQWKVL